MTTQDIIKVLPIEEKEKIQLLNRYERGDKSQRYDIDVLAWRTYFALYNDTLRDNIGREMDLVKQGKAEADQNLYKRALKRTEEEMKEDNTKAVTQTDLAHARTAMEQIMQEIRASKAAKKHHPHKN